MSRWDVIVTDAALEDVREAAVYMRNRLGTPSAGARFVDSFAKQCESHASMPEGGPPVADFELAKLGYRWCPVGNFMMFYRADAETHVVTVDRVLYGARDWKSLL